MPQQYLTFIEFLLAVVGLDYAIGALSEIQLRYNKSKNVYTKVRICKLVCGAGNDQGTLLGISYCSLLDEKCFVLQGTSAVNVSHLDPHLYTDTMNSGAMFGVARFMLSWQLIYISEHIHIVTLRKLWSVFITILSHEFILYIHCCILGILKIVEDERYFYLIHNLNHFCMQNHFILIFIVMLTCPL